jgi:hypothetical protein
MEKMSVYIRGQSVKVASTSDNSGFFIGQNRQDGWDSISPEKQATGYNMGDASVITTTFSGYFGFQYIHQALHDEDLKGNRSRSTME